MQLEQPSRDRRLVLLTGYLLLLVLLIAASESRRVGDGGEYLDMAEDLLRLEPPSLYPHFWFYPALAVPLLWLVRLTPFDPFFAFVPVNLGLLGAAFWAASAVLRGPALALVFVSPIVWWADKTHTEVFTFSLLIVALIALRPPAAGVRGLHPGWAVVCLAAAAAQNPPFLLLVPLAIVFLLATNTASCRDRRFIAFCAAALTLAALHPAYYYFAAGKLSGLAGTTHGRIPNIDEVTAVIRDTNLGLIPNAPVFAIATLLAVGAVVRRSPRRLLTQDTMFALGAGVLFLAAFSQTSNYNHGGTPGLSRYALWLIPLVVPFLRQAGEVLTPRASQSFVVLVTLSSIWNVVAFHPQRSEEAPPSWVASWLWARYPSFDRPLPEVFVERLRATDGRWWLPTATPDCSKILLTGRGDTQPIWPIPCFPAPVPPECRQPRALCYANRHGSRYEFAAVPEPSVSTYLLERQAVWTQEESRTASALLTRLRWWDMSICSVSVRRITRGEFGVGGPRYYCGSDRLVAYFGNRQRAVIRIRLRTQWSGAFVDASTGQVVTLVAYEGEPGKLWDLPIPAGPASVFLVLTAANGMSVPLVPENAEVPSLAAVLPVPREP